LFGHNVVVLVDNVVEIKCKIGNLVIVAKFSNNVEVKVDFNNVLIIEMCLSMVIVVTKVLRPWCLVLQPSRTSLLVRRKFSAITVVAQAIINVIVGNLLVVQVVSKNVVCLIVVKNV
jgi:hypothetical protein